MHKASSLSLPWPLAIVSPSRKPQPSFRAGHTELEPSDVQGELIAVVSQQDKLMLHMSQRLFHLPQPGNDLFLGRVDLVDPFFPK